MICSSDSHASRVSHTLSDSSQVKVSFGREMMRLSLFPTPSGPVIGFPIDLDATSLS